MQLPQMKLPQMKLPQMKLPLAGGCMCGAIRYQISQAPLDVYVCHCTDCQRLTSSAFSMGVVVPDAAFRTLGRTPHAAPDVIAASGRRKSRFICADCGTWLFGNPRPGPAGLFRVIRGGTLDDASWLTPTAHYWTRSRQPWVPLPAGVRQFDTQPDQG